MVPIVTWSSLCIKSRVPNDIAEMLEKKERMELFMLFSEATKETLLKSWSIQQEHRERLLETAKTLQEVSECPMSYILAREN